MWLVGIALTAAGLLFWFRGGLGSPGFVFWHGPFPMLAFAVGTWVQASAGVVLAIRRPGNLVGWLTLLFGINLGLGAALFGYLVYAEAVGISSETRAWIAWFSTWETLPVSTLISIIIGFLFPNGHLISRRWWGAIALATVGAVATSAALAVSPGPLVLYPGIVNPLAGAGEHLWPAIPAALAILVASAPITGYAMTTRYEVADRVGRLQIRWFVTLSLVLEVVFVLFLLALAVLPDDSPYGAWLLTALFLVGGLPAIALLFAILRYRLYDIDSIISRAVVYGALVAVLGGVYAASMGIINKLFLEVFGEPNDAAVVVETLILVTISAPLKPWLDKVVEQRFGQTPKPHEHLSLLDDPTFSAALDTRIAEAIAKATHPSAPVAADANVRAADANVRAADANVAAADANLVPAEPRTSEAS
jgi:hypothetical protein